MKTKLNPNDEMDLTGLTKLSHLLSVPCKVINIGRDNKKIIEFTLFNNDNCLYQLFICEPNVFIPDHSHPDVTNIITPLSGIAKMRRDGDWIKIQGRNYNKSHVIRMGVTHGFETFDEPFVFLSQQIFRVGSIKESLLDNWEGARDFKKTAHYI